MKVSILIPVYGVEKYIARCAESLFAQTYEDVEYIFVDDCSPDRSISILNSVVEKYPERKSAVRVIHHEKNCGLGAARNTAVFAATGDFVYHVDSDDFIDVDCIRLCIEKQKECDADVVSVAYSCVWKKKSFVKKSLDSMDARCLNESVITHTTPNNIWGRLIRKSLYIENEIQVQKGVNMSEDLNVLPKLLFFANRVASINEKPLHFYECENINSYTSSFSRKKFDQEQKTYESLKHFFEPRDAALLSCVIQRELSFYVKSLCDCLKKQNDRDFYEFIQNKIKKLPCKNKSSLKLYEKMALSFKSYVFFLCYVRVGSFIKHLLRK